MKDINDNDVIDIERKSGDSEKVVPVPPLGIGFNSGIKITSPAKNRSSDTNPIISESKKERKNKEYEEISPKKRALLWVRDIGIAVVVAVIIMQFIRPTIVQQHSMENTLHENDYIFINKQAYTFGDIKHGDIIVFKNVNKNVNAAESDEAKNLIKRVIGLPGDTVSIDAGNVYVNGKAISAGHTKDGYTAGYMDEITIPEGKVFAMGDNRQNSMDSRDPSVGLIDMGDVVGEAGLRVYPFNKIGFVE